MKLAAATLFLLASVLLGICADALDIGVFMSLTGGYSSDMIQAYDGITLWRDYVNARWGGVPLSNGTVIPINLIIRDDQSNVTYASTIWQSFVAMGLTVVIGGHTSMTVAASTFFEPYGVINIACCTGPDEVYTVNPRSWILGIHRSSEDYPKGFLNQLHVRGKNNVAIVYNDASSFTITTADSAESFGKSIGMQILSKTSYTGAGYTNLNGTGGQQLATQIASLQRFNQNKTDFALFAICLGPDGQDAARIVAQQNLQLNALFVTVAPTTDAFINNVGPNAAEYVFSPLQWHNSMKFTDPILNSSSDFNRLFLAQRGYRSTYLVASGAAAGVVLHLGLQSAASTNKYVLMQALRELRADTFFGPVAFNRYQRNYGGSTATIEILDSASHAVLPDESAQILTVLPPLRSDLARCPDPTYTNFTKCFAKLDQAVPASADPPYWVIAVVLVPLLTVAVVAGYHIRSKLALAVRPLDATKPFAVMFVGVRNVSELSDLGEGVASSVCSRLAAMIRQCARSSKCFEARRIDESTVMITAKRSEDAIACAAELSELVVLRTRWDVVAVATTAAQRNSAEGRRSKRPIDHGDSPRLSHQHQQFDQRSVRSSARDGTSSATHRVKPTQPQLQIGVHFGFGNIDYDEENNTVSYHGAVVDRAALVTDAAAGNQILVSRELVHALDEMGDVDYIMTNVGHFRHQQTDDKAGVMMFVPRWMTDAFVTAVEHAAVKNTSSNTERVSGSISAALQQAEAGLSLGRVAVVVIDVPWLTEPHEPKDITRIAALCEELEDIASQHRAEVLLFADGQLIFTLNAGTATSMPVLRAASIAVECVQHCSHMHLVASAGVAMSVCVVGRQQGRVTAFGTAVSTARAAQKLAKTACVPVVLAEAGYEDVASRFHVMTIGVMALPSGNLGRVVAVADAFHVEGEWLYTVGGGSSGVAANERAWELIVQGVVPPPDVLKNLAEGEAVEQSGWQRVVFDASRRRLELVLATCLRGEVITKDAVLNFVHAHESFVTSL